MTWTLTSIVDGLEVITSQSLVLAIAELAISGMTDSLSANRLGLGVLEDSLPEWLAYW